MSKPFGNMFSRIQAIEPGSIACMRLSRRQFLKFGSLGFIGLTLPAHLPARQLDPDIFGRALEYHIDIYERPSLSSPILRQVKRDELLPITDVTVGDEEPAYNRVWYQLDDNGYAHSGLVQPVRNIEQPPAAALPERGQLAEVTVPYTDALWWPKTYSKAYRLYYATTHWVGAITQDRSGGLWYQIIDDKLDVVYYAHAEHLRLVPREELAPLSPHIPLENKRLEVRLAEQIVIAYENDVAVFMARAATGAEFSNGNFTTPVGKHTIMWKRPTRHMMSDDLAAANSYDLPGVPWISYFTENGVAFHGTYWHNDYGRPRSHGCVNLSPQAARWVYRWTQPVVPVDEVSYYEPVGTTVDVI